MTTAGPPSTAPARPLRKRPHLLLLSRAALLVIALGLGGCGASSGAGGAPSGASPKVRPQVLEPTAGVQPAAVTPGSPYGDPNAHATPLTEVRSELRLELVAERVTNARYIDPLQNVTVWERTDQGVDAILPIGAPILAPCRVKILDVTPDWYAGQPLVYFELLDGPDAGKVQYVAEQITDIAPPGSILQQGQAIAVYAKSGSAIEYVLDARRRDNGLRGGPDHTGRSGDAHMAECPRRERWSKHLMEQPAGARTGVRLWLEPRRVHRLGSLGL